MRSLPTATVPARPVAGLAPTEALSALRALEAEQFEQLPGHTYIKGFLRTYAESLGMDGQLYVESSAGSLAMPLAAAHFS